MNRRRTLAAVIGGVTALVYLPILRNGFVQWDDGIYVFANPALRSLDLNLLRFALGFETPNWHPLTWFAHALELAVWGLRPVWHHATSILLQAANTYLLFFVVLELLEARDRLRFSDDGPERARFRMVAAAATAVLFGIHPTRVESVAWASGKKDLICTLFVLLVVRAYLAYATAESASPGRGATVRRRYLASVGWFLLALLTKPSVVTFPAILLLLDVYPLGRVRERAGIARLVLEKVPFLVPALAMAAITYFAHYTLGDVWSLEKVGVATRLMVAAHATMAYLVHLVWPVKLLPLYPYPEVVRITMPVYVVSAGAIAAISVACVLLARRHAGYLAVWLYFLTTLVPVIGLVRMGFQAMADRYAYLPSIGPTILLGIAVSLLAARAASAGRLPRLAAVAAGAALALVLSVLTVRQDRIWRDDESLWSHEIDTAPGLSWLAYENRSVVRSGAGWYEGARQDLTIAIALKPGSPALYYNRGNMNVRLRRLEEALSDYTTAISLAKEPDPDYLDNRSVVLGLMQRANEAAADRREAERVRAIRELEDRSRGAGTP